MQGSADFSEIRAGVVGYGELISEGIRCLICLPL